MKRWVSLLAILPAACSTVQTTNPGAIGVERKQLMIVSEEQVEQSAVLAYQKELETATKKGALNANSAQRARVKAIADRLIPQVAVFRPDALKWQWQVNVQTNPDLNAYCMPGGKIMVYSGLIEKLQVTDAELATVIGHEIAHALREHTRERLSRDTLRQAGLTIAAIATGAGDAVVGLADQISQVTLALPHSREQEAEADRIGLELMARAGYDPNAAVSLWQKMSREGGSSGPSFLSTHPTSADRLDDLQANIPRVLPLYQAAPKS